MASKFSTVLDLLERYSVSSIVPLRIETFICTPPLDEAHRRHSLRSARQEPHRPDQESRTGPVFPTILINQT